MCSSQLGGGKLCSSSFSVKQLHTVFEIFLLRKSLSLFTYVHNYVLISIWNCKYLVFTLHYNPIQVNFVAQIIPAWAIGGRLFWLLGPFDVLPCGDAWVFFFFHLLFLFSTSMLSGTCEMLQAPLADILAQYWDQLFLQRALVPFIEECHQKSRYELFCYQNIISQFSQLTK